MRNSGFAGKVTYGYPIMYKTLLQKIFTSILILSFLLISPLGASQVHATEVPDPVAPGNGDLITVVEAPSLAIPEFKWSAVSGATSYRLQVSGDTAFTATVINITTPNTSYTPTNAAVFPDGTWYWRVRVEAPAPIGDYSGIRSFIKQWAIAENKPSLNDPANGTTVDFYDSPVFKWTAVIGAAKYKFQIYTTPGGWSNTTYAATTLATTHQPNSKLANGSYYWRVVPVDAGGHDGTPSDEYSFNAGYNMVPTPLAPANGSNPTFTPTFQWTAVRGAEFYRLQYSTDPTFSTGVTTVDTRNTTYTPTATMPNDVNYYWRVQVHSGNSIAEWTETRSFIKKWYIKPVLLTPVNLYQHVRFPIFSWTPVPGAAYYKVEISADPGFGSIYASGTTANTFYTPTNWTSAPMYYWRVTPYDGNGNKGKESNTSSFVSYDTSVAPHLVYPLYYYLPNQFSGYPEVTTNPYEDRAVALPIFMWNRVYKPAGDPNQGAIYAEAYRLQVAADSTFSSVLWTIDTENTVAAPDASHPFTPLAGMDYFWRVRPLISGVEVGEWSQIWKTRFDPTRGLTPTLTTVPTLIRPTDGFEYAEATPLLEWFPISGAASYEVQISSDAAFSTIINSASVSYPAYAPAVSLAQRSLGAVDFGIFYWRVRETGGVWGDGRRFQIAAQSQWQYTRTLGDSANRLQIGSDPTGDVADADYDLSNLQVSQSSNYWYFGFKVPASPSKNLNYALYLDVDHVIGSGATSDARGYSITTIPGYRPEFAIYILQEAGAFTASNVFLYHWNGSGWDTIQLLSSIGGDINFNTNYVELKIPNTAIGYQDTTGSYAVTLLSLPAGTSGAPQDSVPADPNVPGSGAISHFSNVTERLNTLMPPNDAGVDPSTFPSILPFFWDWPILSPWAGANMKAYLDPLFTTEAATYTLTSSSPYYARTFHAWSNDFQGDNTYYWRIQPRYKVGSNYYNGAWSQGWRFERQGFVPQNLQTSVTFATPTFSWDLVEGAESYDLQVDDDPAFGSTAININTKQNSYTNTTTLANATYYWRVRVRRNGGVINNWTTNQSFTLALPAPTGLNHVPGGVVDCAPTLCWTPLVQSQAGTPVLAAWKYRIQVSKDPTFTSIFDNIDTEQSCWTPIKGYDDGDYYWRVAMIDGNGKLGNYSPYATLTKQYPITTLVSPVSGSTINETPTFVWSPVNGAAKYRLQVSIASNFSTTYDSVDTNNTRYTPVKAYVNNTYYWRVAILDADGKIGPFNNATIIINPYPAAFSKLSPTNGAGNQAPNLMLTWETASGASSFEYCIDTSNDNSCAGSWISTGFATSLSLSSLSPATYYWQIRAKNSYGYTYANAETWWSFTVPPGPSTFNKTSPLNNGISQLTNIKLKWGASSPLDQYMYCVDTTNNDTCDSVWTATGTVTSATVPVLASDTYYWQVKAVYGYGTTFANSGSWWSFTAIDISPDLDEKLNTSKVTFDWGDIPGATKYKVQLSLRSDFATLVFSTSTTGSEYAYPTRLLNDTLYYWRIKAYVGGVWSAWSNTWSFESMDPLAAPQPTDPLNKSTLASTSVTLRWNSVMNGYQYKVQVSKYPDFSVLLLNAKTNPGDLFKDWNAPGNGKYFWRVRAFDSSGGKGPWSATWIFKVYSTP